MNKAAPPQPTGASLETEEETRRFARNTYEWIADTCHALDPDGEKENVVKRLYEVFRGYIRHGQAVHAASISKGFQIVGELPEGVNVFVRKALTERQREGMRRVLRRLASATSARWDQHLRYEIPDADADAVIAWIKSELNALPEGKTHYPDCEANRVGVGGDGLCDMSCGEEPPDWGMFL